MFQVNRFHAILIYALQVSLMAPTFAESTTMAIADVPLDISIRRSNIFFDMDNSGSMDWEIITNQTGRFTLDSAIPWYISSRTEQRIGHLFPSTENDTDGITLGGGTNTIAPATSEFAYLRSSDFNKIYYNPKVDYSPWDKAYDGGSITFANASTSAARSHPYILTNGTKSTSCSSSSSCLLLNLEVVNEDQISVARNVLIPLTVPGPNSTNLAVKNSNGNAISSAYTTTGVTTVIVPNYPATYWLKDSSCTTSTYPSSSWSTCAAAPDGTMMRRHDIVNDSRYASTSFTLPDGTTITRSRAQELQNFANWYSFYRKRKLLAAGSIANTLDNLQKSQSRISAGFIPFNNRASGTPTMYDLSLEDTTANAASNGRALMARFYTMLAQGGTPTLTTLSYSAARYGYDSSPFPNTETGNATLRCQINTSIVVTDGFANDYNKNSLYAIAKAAYDGMRWWTPFKAAYPSDTTYTTGNLGNTMNTYAITLGALGNKFGITPTPTATPNPQTDNLWSNPSDDSPTAVDDLWRATLYSRGKMLLANNPTELQSGMSSILASLIKASSDTNISVSNVNVKAGDNLAVYGTYSPSDWTGDLKAYPISLTTGAVDMTTTVWSAREQLNARTADGRIIATWDGSAGIPFRPSSMSSTYKTIFNTGSNSDADDVINWLRGDRTKETDTYRARNGILGDIVDSQPVYVAGAAASYSDSGYGAFKANIANRKRVVYVGANDGMLHAFDATYCTSSASSSSSSAASSSASSSTASSSSCSGGKELWAYVPKLVHSKLNTLSSPAYQHKFNVDGRITVWDADLGTSSPDWKTVLVGGLRHGGTGFFALDVTAPEYANETALASKVLWEFTDSDMGESFGKPVIVKTTTYGWVALLTSGYNNTDGKGYLYVVKLKDGTLIKKIATPEGSTSSQVGLAQITALAAAASATTSASSSGLVKWVYGGDLNGNLWRFDLSNNDSANWSVKKLASSLGINGAQPITSAPELAYISTTGQMPTYQYAADVKASRLMVYVGTGKLLHGNDIDSTADIDTEKKNGFFAIEDADDGLIINTGACASLACLVKNGLGQEATGSNGLNNWGTISNSSLTSWWQIDKHSFNWDGRQRVMRGWYIAFSETGGEGVITDPTAAYGFISFTTTMKTDSRHGTAGVCETTYSALYVLAADKGGELGDQSRWNLGFGVATTPAVYTTTTTSSSTSSSKVHETVCLQGSCQTIDPNVTIPTSSNTLKRFGWKEIFR